MLKKTCNWLALFSILMTSIVYFYSCQKSIKRPLVEWMADTGKIKVLSTTAQIGDLVATIGGDRIDSLILIQGSLDPHSYELVKGDGEKLERADLIFYNGLGLEHGASLSEWLHTSQKTIAIGETILERCPDKILYKGNAIDPHIWMDVSLWMEGTEGIAESLSAQDPDGAAYYRERALALYKQMEEAHLEIREILRRVPPEKRYLVTSHDAFHYFTRSYLREEGESDWERRFEAPEGLAPDGQLSPMDIKRTISYLKDHQVRVLFPESNISRDAIYKIAEVSKELGLSVRICREPLYGDAMDQEHLHYIDTMKHNATTIANQLGEM